MKSKNVYVIAGPNYPPDLQEKAVDTVLSQAKLMAENLIEEDVKYIL